MAQCFGLADDVPPHLLAREQALLALHGPKGVNAWTVTRPGRAGEEAWGVGGAALEVRCPPRA